MPTPNLTPATTGVIIDKGTKGLLKWIQQSMPDFYAALSPALVAQARGNTLGRMGCGPQMGRVGRMGRMGDFDGSDDSGDLGMGDLTFDSTSVADPSVFQDLTVTPQSTTTDASSVASSAPTSTALATTISTLAGAVATGTLASAQISANNTLLQTNLARAQQGLAPLTSVSSAGGLTSLTSGNSTILLIGVALIAALAFGSRKSTT